MNNQHVIDGCTFSEVAFEGLSEEVKNSKLTAFFLTVHGQMDSFQETIVEIGKLYNRADDDDEKFVIVKTYDELLKAKANDKKALILTFQDPHPIENSMAKLRVCYELGVRVYQLTYNYQNFIGTGCMESKDFGLTDFGVQVVKELNRLGGLIDLSHCSYKTAIDTLAVSEKPVIYSHAGSHVLTPCPRNKRDDEIMLLKENGGVIGLSPWGPLCWKPQNKARPTMDDYIDHINYVVDMIGIDHVGFGGDSTLDNGLDLSGLKEVSALYDSVVGGYNKYVGMDPMTRHAIGLRGCWEIENLEQALIKKGYSKENIYKLTGGNFLRVIKETWK